MKNLSTGIILSSVAATYLLGVTYVCPGNLVRNNLDNGDSSLRACIERAAVGDTVSFNEDFNITLESHINMSGKDISIDGTGQAIVIDGNNSSPIFTIINSSLTLSDLTLQDGNSSNGGAISSYGNDLNITNCTISHNTATDKGGAIFSNNSDIKIIDSNISSNTAFSSGGAIFSTSGNLTLTDSIVSSNSTPGFGGAITIYADHDDANLTIKNSTISSNSANTGGVITSYSYYATANLVISDSTISNNTASNYAVMSIYSHYADTITITNSTISGNAATNSIGAIDSDYAALRLEHVTITNNSSPGSVAVLGADIEVSNSIISGNSGSADFTSVTSLGHNILGTGTVIDQNTSDIITTDPQLKPLADNGGPTLTHLPMPTSPAVDAGSSLMTLDQRGVFRPQGDAVDIGAVELEGGYTAMPAIIMYLLD